MTHQEIGRPSRETVWASSIALAIGVVGIAWFVSETVVASRISNAWYAMRDADCKDPPPQLFGMDGKPLHDFGKVTSIEYTCKDGVHYRFYSTAHFPSNYPTAHRAEVAAIRCAVYGSYLPAAVVPWCQ